MIRISPGRGEDGDTYLKYMSPAHARFVPPNGSC